MSTNTIPANPTRPTAWTDDLGELLACDRHLTMLTESGMTRMSDSSGGNLVACGHVGTYTLTSQFVLATHGAGGVALDVQQAAYLANLLIEFVNGAPK